MIKPVLRKCHLQSLSDAIELSLIASLTALLADLIWLLHDVYSNGLSIVYCVVFIGLLLGNIITAIALYRHHSGRVCIALKKLLKEKLLLQHQINKHKDKPEKTKVIEHMAAKAQADRQERDDTHFLHIN